MTWVRIQNNNIISINLYNILLGLLETQNISCLHFLSLHEIQNTPAGFFFCCDIIGFEIGRD